jgi:cell division septum initiation protein DivIVA
VDVEAHLSQMEQLLAEARPVPLSASVMVNRRDFDELLVSLRNRLPEELRQSRWVLKERDELLAQAAREADQVLADAQIERERLVSDTDVVRAAQREADRIIAEAREEARRLRLDAEDYVDGKLASFEIVLGKTLRAVEKGRERLRGRLTDELAEATGPAAPEPALDESGEIDFSEIPRQFYDQEEQG